LDILVSMTYFPQDIFKNILSYCNDIVKQKTKINHQKIMEDINYYTNFEYEEYCEVDELLQHTSCYDDYYKSSDLHLRWINQDFRVY